jgi:nucleoside-diphosphate-sugar epimerase
MSDTILITGGAGAIGSILTNTLARDPANQIVVLDNLSSGRVENIRMSPNVRFLKGGVESDEDLDLAFETPPQVIFHLAANFANQNSVDFPQRDLIVNGLGTLKVLLRALDVGVRRLVYTSSSCVYGNRDEPLDEKCREFSLDTPYAVTKLLGENYVRFFWHHHKLPAVTLRYFNVYGPNEYPGKYRNVIANFFYRAMRNEDIVITGTGDETRDFNYVEDTVRATILASQTDHANGKVFNVASGKETTINQLAEMILRITGSRSRIVHRQRRGWDSVVRRVAAADLAREVLNYQARTSIETGLAAYYDWLRRQDMNKCEW